MSLPISPVIPHSGIYPDQWLMAGIMLWKPCLTNLDENNEHLFVIKIYFVILHHDSII